MASMTFEEAVSLAIEREIGAAALYDGAAKVSTRPDAKRMFEELAEEEREHRRRLEGLEPSKIAGYRIKKIPDMGIGTTTEETAFDPDMGYQKILTFAIAKETEANQFYERLATEAQDPGVQKLFTILAQEEAKHRLRLQDEYDEHVLTWN
jgi:rubrerythrin